MPNRYNQAKTPMPGVDNRDLAMNGLTDFGGGVRQIGQQLTVNGLTISVALLKATPSDGRVSIPRTGSCT